MGTRKGQRGVRVRRLTAAEITGERARLLSEAGMSERKLRQRGAAYKLNARERVILREVDDLKWLMA